MKGSFGGMRGGRGDATYQLDPVIISSDGPRSGVAGPIAPRARVVIGIRALGFHQEVLDFLERDPKVEVVAALADPARVARALADAQPDVIVLCPTLARDFGHPSTSGRGAGFVVVAEEMTVPVLREAIDVGAAGVFAWPEERDELSKMLARSRKGRSEEGSERGRVIAVYGARGGAGTTFVATHLSAALADEGRRCVLVDLDTSFADVTVALGIGPDQRSRTIADLVPVMEELAPDHVEDALFSHPRGFGVLLAPSEVDAGLEVPAGLYSASVALLAGAYDEVVLHVPRAIDDVARAGVGMSDEVLLVLTLDLFSIYGARRALASLRLNEPPGRCRLVINRIGRAEVASRDIQRVLGLTPAASLRFDPAIGRAQDRGGLLSPKARRTGRDLRSLARLLAPHSPAATRAGD
jgi:pilus assembly protein CpaE